MTVQEHIEAAEKRYTELQAERESLLKQADEINVELTKLQGEWRVLQELLTDRKPNKKASTIEVPKEVTS